MRVAALALMAGVLALAGCGESEPEAKKLSAIMHGPQENAPLAKAALDRLANLCPGLFGARDDLEAIEIDPQPTGKLTFGYEKYGWEPQLWVKVKVVDAPKRLSPQAGGHTMHFALGGGHTPGAVSLKDVSSDICGWPYSDQSAGFKADPAFQVLDRLKL